MKMVTKPKEELFKPARKDPTSDTRPVWDKPGKKHNEGLSGHGIQLGGSLGDHIKKDSGIDPIKNHPDGGHHPLPAGPPDLWHVDGPGKGHANLDAIADMVKGMGTTSDGIGIKGAQEHQPTSPPSWTPEQKALEEELKKGTDGGGEAHYGKGNLDQEKLAEWQHHRQNKQIAENFDSYTSWKDRHSPLDHMSE